MTTRVLMIEDDEALAAMVGEFLAARGLVVETEARAGSGLARVEREAFDAVILDVMLPDFDGFEVCRRIRERSSVPILMLTARGEETDRVVGLELGADDYLPKPFGLNELHARLRAILRRTRSGAERGRASMRFGRLEIDRDARIVAVAGEVRSLTSHQFELLCALAESAGRVLSRDQLMQRLRGHSLEAFDRSIDNHVSRIRAAIEDDPRHPRRLITVRGAGYVFARSQDGDLDA